MALNLVLIAQKQSDEGVSLSWNGMEGVSAYQVFVSTAKLTPDELEATAALGGTDDCIVVKVGSEVHALVDDVTSAGESRHYGVAMIFDDGSVKAARFKAAGSGAPPDAYHLSAARNRQATGTYRVKPAAAPAAKPAAPKAQPLAAAPKPVTSTARVAPPAEPAAAKPKAEPAAAKAEPAKAEPAVKAEAKPADSTSEEDAAAVRKAAAEEDAAVRKALAEEEARKALEERKQKQAAARAKSEAASETPRGKSDAASDAPPPPPPSSVPLDGPLDLRMRGATQTWDGLRLYWERDSSAAAYEIVVSDHQVFGDELADVLAGRADFTTAVAVAPSVTCVIDNITPRDARGWYAVLARAKDGARTPLSFELGDAEASGRTSAPFINPNRTGELRAEVEGLLADAREQWERWKAEQDGGARREARRMISDALLMWPDYPAAMQLKAELS